MTFLSAPVLALRNVLLLRLGDDAAHVLGSQLGVLVDEVDAHRLAVHHRQRMAQFETGLTLVPDVEQSEHFSQGLLVALQGDSVGSLVVLAAVVP